jgi:HK97 gp10 family phage protein
MIELKFSFDDKDLKLFRQNSFKFGYELDKAIKRFAMDVRNTAVKGISQGARHGRLYRRRRVTHQASAPYEYPKTDTGRLVNSIRTDFSYLTAEIGSDVNYSQYLETGTANMQPRPWLEPSYEKNRDKWLDYINTALRRTFNLD